MLNSLNKRRKVEDKWDSVSNVTSSEAMSICALGFHHVNGADHSHPNDPYVCIKIKMLSPPTCIFSTLLIEFCNKKHLRRHIALLPTPKPSKTTRHVCGSAYCFPMKTCLNCRCVTLLQLWTMADVLQELSECMNLPHWSWRWHQY